MNEELDNLRRYAKLAEDKEAIINTARSVGIVTDCRNDLELAPEIIQAAYAAGIDPTSEAFRRLVRSTSEVIAQFALVICNLADTLVEIFNEVWPWAIETVEETQKMIEQCADIDEPEEPDRHDGAVEVLVIWLLPVPTLYELYGQGVDHGGPGPSRLTLIRVTDDGLRRAETGQIRKGENTMIIFWNILLGLIAFVLFMGVVGEKDAERHKKITMAFIATLAAIVLTNFVA